MGVSLRVFVRTGCAIEFRCKLRRCSASWVPQDGMGWGIHYCSVLCHLRNLLGTNDRHNSEENLAPGITDETRRFRSLTRSSAPKHRLSVFRTTPPPPGRSWPRNICDKFRMCGWYPIVETKTDHRRTLRCCLGRRGWEPALQHRADASRPRCARFSHLGGNTAFAERAASKNLRMTSLATEA